MLKTKVRPTRQNGARKARTSYRLTRRLENSKAYTIHAENRAITTSLIAKSGKRETYSVICGSPVRGALVGPFWIQFLLDKRDRLRSMLYGGWRVRVCSGARNRNTAPLRYAHLGTGRLAVSRVVLRHGHGSSRVEKNKKALDRDHA